MLPSRTQESTRQLSDKSSAAPEQLYAKRDRQMSSSHMGACRSTNRDPGTRGGEQAKCYRRGLNGHAVAGLRELCPPPATTGIESPQILSQPAKRTSTQSQAETRRRAAGAEKLALLQAARGPSANNRWPNNSISESHTAVAGKEMRHASNAGSEPG